MGLSTAGGESAWYQRLAKPDWTPPGWVFAPVWSFIFFGMQRIGWALVDILVLWVLLALTTAQFARTDRVASYLLLPYLAWVSFATALNAAIERLRS